MSGITNFFSLQPSGRPGPRSIHPPKSTRSIPKLNRSRNLPPVRSYEEARDVRKKLGTKDA